MKPQFIDIHCHLDLLNKPTDEILKNAKKEGVGIIVNCGTDSKSNKKALELSKKYPEIKSSLGIYPIDALKLSDEQIDEEIEFIKKNSKDISAIGEVGIDLKESQNLEKQKENFIKFILLAQELNKPIITHSRKAEQEVIEVLEQFYNKKSSKDFYPVIMHCFCGKKKLVERVIKNKWFLSIPTNVTFNEQFQENVKLAPVEQLFCETDSPFLHPEKGKFDNEPANIIYSYKKIAEIKNLSLEEIKKNIFENYKRVFT